MSAQEKARSAYCKQLSENRRARCQGCGHTVRRIRGAWEPCACTRPTQVSPLDIALDRLVDDAAAQLDREGGAS